MESRLAVKTWPSGLGQALKQLAVLVVLGMGLLAQTVWADPPGRVGRVAELEGSVWMFDAESSEWLAALRNRPLTAGDRISTDASARTVLRIGPSTVMVGGQTEIEVLQLDDERVRFQVHKGSIALRLRTRETAQEFQVVTREASFNPERAGHYRIERQDDTSLATTWQGQLRADAGRGSRQLSNGQKAEFYADGSQLLSLGNDAFTDWVMTLESREERSVSARYVSPEMTGAEELDRYGRWEQTPEYGAVWFPARVEPDWAPYSRGRWVSVAPWGWTWVDDAPWGFAPFHYGRWAHHRGAWCWVPGTYVQRPVYAPALVAWVGQPPLSVSVTVGPRRPPPLVGWFPLGPREVYVPAYQVTPVYVRNINIHHVSDVTVINRVIDGPRRPPHEQYLNRDVRNAVTVVQPGAIGPGRPVERISDPGTIQQVVNGGVRVDAGLPLVGPVRANGPAGANAPSGAWPQRPNAGTWPSREARPESGPDRAVGVPISRDRLNDERGPRPAVATPGPATQPAALPGSSSVPLARDRDRERERDFPGPARPSAPEGLRPIEVPVREQPARELPNGRQWNGPVAREPAVVRELPREMPREVPSSREWNGGRESALPMRERGPERSIERPAPQVQLPQREIAVPAPAPQMHRAEPPPRPDVGPQRQAPQEPPRKQDKEDKREGDPRRDRGANAR